MACLVAVMPTDPSLSIPDPSWEPKGSALASRLLPGPALLSGLQDPETLWQSALPGTVGLWGPGTGSPRGRH